MYSKGPAEQKQQSNSAVRNLGRETLKYNSTIWFWDSVLKFTSLMALVKIQIFLNLNFFISKIRIIVSSFMRTKWDCVFSAMVVYYRNGPPITSSCFSWF